MPKYELIDLDGRWTWIRQRDQSYLVGITFEQEFLEKCRLGLII